MPDEPDSGAVSSEQVRVTLDLAPRRRPIEGSLTVAPAEARSFTGWMELVAALESVLEEAARPPEA